MSDAADRPRASSAPPRAPTSAEFSAVARTAPRAASVDAPRLALLGLNLWAVLLAIPAAYSGGAGGAQRLLLLGAPLLVLAAGTYALVRSSPGAMWLLIGVFPPALVAVMATRPELRGLDAYPPLGLALGALSLVAFGGSAAAAVTRPRATRLTTRQALASPPEPVPGAAKRMVARRLLLGVGALGALALVAIAPALGGRPALERAWGDSASEGALLASVAGSALATLVLSVFIGPALRADRPRTAPRSSLRRALLALLVVVSGVVAYALYASQR